MLFQRCHPKEPDHGTKGLPFWNRRVPTVNPQQPHPDQHQARPLLEHACHAARRSHRTDKQKTTQPISR
jgi:hypothetical protein